MQEKQLLGKVFKLFISNENSTNDALQIIIDENGVLQDKHYNKDLDRSVFITSKNVYDLVKNKNIHIEYGDLKENIIFDFDTHQLNIGDKIQIKEIIFQVTKNETVCEGLRNTLGNDISEIIKNDRGKLIKSTNSGTIDINDLVYRID